MRPRPRILTDMPNADFPSDEEIARGAPDTVRAAEAWLAEHDRETAALLAQIDAQAERWKRGGDPEEPSEKYRYTGGASHVPTQYEGQTCEEVGPEARRRTSRRIQFADGMMTTIKFKLLEPVT